MSKLQFYPKKVSSFSYSSGFPTIAILTLKTDPLISESTNELRSMEEASTSPVSDESIHQASFQIPYDVFVTKKHSFLSTRAYLIFTDSFGNLLYKVEPHHSSKLLLDASGNCLISLHHLQNGSWNGFRGSQSSKELVFRLERSLNELTRTEFEIFLVGGEHGEDSKTDFKMKGSPFKRSCTIYKGDSIVAETSLMYKLGIKKIFVPRTRFRVTLFPGFVDHSLVVALLIIYFNGRKFWI